MSNMDRQSGSYLKKLLEAVPHGFFVDSKWLKQQGISRQLVSQYIKQGWLKRVAYGVYRRPEQQLEGAAVDFQDWEALVLSMQLIMNYAVHVGGTTALRRQGHGHYVSMGNQETVFLYGQKVPNWLKSIPTNTQLEMRNCKLFSNPEIGLKDRQSNNDNPPWRWSLNMSSPERAILEAMNELPDKESFHIIDMMFQGLVNLRPRLMTELLLACTSIKVKRLFFVFADHHNHTWRKHINDTIINLGSGDRSLAAGGKLHPKYRIMIPKDLMPKRTEDANETT